MAPELRATCPGMGCDDALAMRRRRRLTAAVAAAGCGLARTAAGASMLNGFDLQGALMPAEAILPGGPPRDGIPAIDRPRFVDAARLGLAPKDRVLGPHLGMEARAYPARILNWPESQRPCRRPDGGHHLLPVVRQRRRLRRSRGRAGGELGCVIYKSDLPLYDRGTRSLWSPIMGRAVSRPLKGTPLVGLALKHTSWAGWRAREFGTRVLSAENRNPRDYSCDPCEGDEAVPRLMFDVQHRDDRVDVEEWVLGMVVDGPVKAYPFERLARRLGNEGTLQHRIAGRPALIGYHAGQRTAEAFDAEGRPLPAVTAYWFAWVTFHPQTELLAER